MPVLIDKEIVILNMVKNNYVGLDGIGKRIWGLLEKPVRGSKGPSVLPATLNSSSNSHFFTANPDA